MRHSLLLVVLLSGMMQLPSAVAFSNKQPEVTKEQATTLAQQRFPGKVLKVKTEEQHYRVRLLQADGRVITVLVDIRTGRVERDDN